MGPDFLVRTLRATAASSAILALALAAFVDVALALAVAAGSGWSILNVVLLGRLVRTLGYRGKPGNPVGTLLLFGLKGPLLYLAGYLLLKAGLSPLGLSLGFSLVFAVVTLRALGQWLVHPEWRKGAATLGLVAALALSAGAAAAKTAPPEHGAAATTTETHAEAAHGEAPAHGEEAHEEGAPELPNVVTYLRAAYAGKEQPAWLHFVHEWENIFFSLFAAIVLIALFGTAARPKQVVPGRMQNAAEALLGGVHDFFLGVLGPSGRRYVPFVGSLMLYIVTMNWMGMIPFLKSPSTSLNTTLALAIVVFCYVQYIGISRNGLGGYLYHFAGQPKDAIGWGSAVLLFPLEVMGEFIKPISLSCRLFGNILGEDILLAVFVGLGVTTLSFIHSPIGLPLQLPFLVLSALFGLVQGLVFALLTTVYIVMMLPHDEHEHHEAHTSDAHAVAHP
jgi:F-type H+-transporting ATPase subunit a